MPRTTTSRAVRPLGMAANTNAMPPVLNPVINPTRKECEDRHLVRRLENTKARINNAPPRSAPHLANNAKKRLAEQQRVEKIENENAILLSKLTAIARSPPTYPAPGNNTQNYDVVEPGTPEQLVALSPSPSQASTTSTSTRSRPSSAKSFQARQRERKIMEENRAMLRRLESARGSLKPKKWERHAEQHAYLRDLRSNLPRHVRERRAVQDEEAEYAAAVAHQPDFEV